MLDTVKIDTISRRVAAALRDEILSGRLGGLRRLSQEELARRFRVSRIPIRDALRILESEGLIDYNPRYGAFVAEMSLQNLEELYDMRLSLEPDNAALATVHMEPRDAEEIEDLLRAMESHRDSPREWFLAHAKFHEAINLLSRRPLVNTLLTNLRKQTERYVRLYQLVEADPLRLHREHEAIFTAATVKHDPSLIQKAVRRHLEMVRDEVIAYLVDQPERKAGDQSDYDLASGAR